MSAIMVHLNRSEFGPDDRTDEEDQDIPGAGSVKASRESTFASAQLPPGWQKKMKPFPPSLERECAPLPPGYRRGVIDAHAVIYNSRGIIIDVAVLF